MHRPGTEPEIADDIFSPLSRLVDPSYDRAAAQDSARRAHADRFNERAKKRTWVNELEVLVDIGPGSSLRAAA
jgi:hypothetical protein